jgi:hypothetical protein
VNSYYLDASCDKDAGAVAKSSEDLKSAAFLALLNGDGSAFVSDTNNINGGYPILAWQVRSVENNTTGGGGGGGGGAPVAQNEDEPNKDEQPQGDDRSAATSAGGASSNTFSDVKTADWFYADVEYAVATGLFNGTSANAFSPNEPMTRGMIVTVLGRLYDADTSAYTAGGFDDVAAGQYYTAYAEWAKENGIVGGVGGNLFAPGNNISRQDFAVILMRYADFAGKQFPVTRQFVTFADDAEIADYAKNAVQTLYNGGIINGVGGDAINPKGSATRAEVAAMLHRFIDATESN